MNAPITTVGPAINAEIITATKIWVETAVIGLNLCPFAKSVHVKNQIRYVVSDASCSEALLASLASELTFLATSDPDNTDNTLLIHPYVLTDFLEYNDFLGVADAVLEEMNLAGVIQIASFHPHYQFAGTHPDEMSNYTNRSPYPTLHLLREKSIENAVKAFPDAAEIFEKNIARLESLGLEGWELLLKNGKR